MTGQYRTVAELRAATPPADWALATVAGYWATGDGGGGLFTWEAGDVTPDDGGCVIAPKVDPGAGRWLRVINDAVSIRWFGASPVKSDNTAAIQNAVNFVAAQNNGQGGKLRAPAGAYGCRFTAGTSGLSTITISTDGVIIKGEGLATQFLVRNQPAGTFVQAFFTWTKPGKRGTSGGIHDCSFFGNSQLLWAVSLDCWRMWGMSFVEGWNLYGGLLDAHNQQQAFGIEGENILVHHVGTKSFTGGPSAQYGVRFRPSLASAALAPWSDVQVDQALFNAWDTGVVFDSVSRSSIRNTAACRSISAVTTTDGQEKAGCLHAVQLVNSADKDVGRNVVDSIYLESHHGTETPDVHYVVDVDATNTGRNYHNRISNISSTPPTNRKAGFGPGLVRFRNTSARPERTASNSVNFRADMFDGFTSVTVDPGVVGTSISLLTDAPLAGCVKDEGVGTRIVFAWQGL
jgi:hypothetical protein